MNFEEAFFNSLNTNSTLTKSLPTKQYIPEILPTPEFIEETLPYVQAFKDITCTYPYTYEIADLDSYCIIYTESGCGSLEINNHNYVLTPKSFAFIHCKEKHCVEIKQSPWRFKVFFINGTTISCLYHTFISTFGNLQEHVPGSTIPNMIHKLYSVVNKAKDETLYQTKYLIDILIESIMEKKLFEEKKNIIPYYIADIKEKFDYHYQDSYTLDALEQEYHISKYRICREFNEHFDTSPIQYLTNRRIEVAKETLISSDKRVNEIGRMVGYENTNLFIRLFKEQTGITPLVFRKKSPVLPYFTSLEPNEKIH